jgi:glutamate/tyrosine decarboxylase-like PLP-dependent enzyme
LHVDDREKVVFMIDLAPDTFRELGYRAVDMIAEQLAAIHDAPVRQTVPDDLRERLMHTPLSTDPVDPAVLLEQVAELILPYPMGNASPRFFAWVNSPPAPLGALADMIAAAHNASVAGGDHAATYVEHSVLNWIKAMFGFPEESGAILASGGSIANLIGLAVMRHIKGKRVRADGFYSETAPMVIYTSTQGHSCVQKAVELLGFGGQYLRKIPVDRDCRMDMEALKAAIASDRDAGLRPVCVAASAGTVNTGAIDPLDEIADLCRTEGLWFHVDGAYGGFAILAPEVASHFEGIERADSLAVDPHKWLYVPVECGCALVRDQQAMRDAFSLVPPYLRDDTTLPWFSEFGVQQTRGFRALKLWMTLQQVGENGYRDLISRDINLARVLRERIRVRGDFELLAAGPLSVTCFRYTPPDEMWAADVHALNRALLDIVQREGRVFLTSTDLNGAFTLRACIINFRTSEADLDALLDTIAEAGQRIMAQA